MQNNQTTDTNSVAESAAEAEKLEAIAKNEPDNLVYTHQFKKPFTYQNVTYEQLTFDWSTLTGNDYIAIETEMLRRRKTLIVPEYTSEFLCAMAARACTNRNEEGFRILNTDAMKAMPMRDFQAICRTAQYFLLRAE